MKTSKSKIAYAVVNKLKPIIKVNDIFDTDDISIGKNEQIIKVEIKQFKHNGKQE